MIDKERNNVLEINGTTRAQAVDDILRERKDIRAPM
jgi:hypothetical protein